jgi:uncharacterized protein (DUF1697 family)
MATWIALFRGINVGGSHLLPMKRLTTLLERDGFGNVRTYIQSGNVVFQSPRGTAKSIAARMGQLVLKDHGFEPEVIVLSLKELEQAAAGNPFPKAEAEPKTLHLFFLCETPRAPDLESLNGFKAGKEAFSLRGKVFYLHTPDGFGTSKLVQKVGRAIGVEMTARNWRTVTTLIEMARL